jgi:hypothetical protein
MPFDVVSLGRDSCAILLVSTNVSCVSVGVGGDGVRLVRLTGRALRTRLC